MVLAALAAVGLALAMHWPLPLHVGRDVPRDLGDPLPQAWQVAWDGHALLHQPLDFFQANVFWPLKNSLAFSDALVGYAPAGVIGSGPHAAIVRYDLLFLFAYTLAFLGAYLLARELGAGRVGGFVAGAAFAYAPWRVEAGGHPPAAGGGRGRRVRGRGRVRVRAVAARAGRSPARAVVGRDPAVPVPARARISPGERAPRAGRVARGGVAAVARLLAGAAARVPALRAGGRCAGVRLAAGAPRLARECGRARRVRPRRGAPGPPLPRGRPRPPGVEAHRRDRGRVLRMATDVPRAAR